MRRNSFCILCFSHSSSGLGVLLIFLIWAAPLTFRQEAANDQINTIMGQLIIVFWYATLYCRLGISINRLIAIAVPIQAAKLLTRRNSFVLVLVVWCLAICHASPYFWGTYCHIHYDCNMWRWIIIGSHWGKTCIYVEKCGMIIMISTFTLDVVAVVKFRKSNKVFSSNNANMFMSEAQKRKVAWRSNFSNR
ncbi:unnamed protein product [Cylicocyclus nassatus]|uniref:G-protein coupled receptors family 1 profile domain-containing protein n=1 Tax=Cylicocyclus nassatus TaxID=53992 RepID=A0AA36GGG9_CYLNA|nr:unnamed protein product [Cylicocyclus nassatus]